MGNEEIQDNSDYSEAKAIINREPTSHETAKESHDIEREITAVRIDRLKASPIKGNYDFKHLSAIHKRIFDKLYDHAGQKRPKTEIWAKQGHMSFRSIFADIDNAEKMVDDARDKLGDFKNLAKEEFVDKFTEAYAEVNQAHPFEEGNGRATRTMFEQLADEAGYKLDLSEVPKQQWDIASLKSGRHQQLYERGLVKVDREPDTSLLKAVMAQALKPVEREINQEKLSLLNEEQKTQVLALRAILNEVYADDPVKKQVALDKVDSNIEAIANGDINLNEVNIEVKQQPVQVNYEPPITPSGHDIDVDR